jgi:hypothetical protein
MYCCQRGRNLDNLRPRGPRALPFQIAKNVPFFGTGIGRGYVSYSSVASSRSKRNWGNHRTDSEQMNQN